jgi:hypothetical protein
MKICLSTPKKNFFMPNGYIVLAKGKCIGFAEQLKELASFPNLH